MPKSLYQKGHNGTCKFEFPYFPHIEPNYFFNKKNENIIDHNMKIEMLPYHPTLLLLLEANLNIFCITSSYWYFYLLKYGMKCESHGKLNLNIKMQNN
jgi:hypothetical protein